MDFFGIFYATRSTPINETSWSAGSINRLVRLSCPLYIFLIRKYLKLNLSHVNSLPNLNDDDGR